MKNQNAIKLGKLRWEGKTKKEIKKEMSKIGKISAQKRKYEKEKRKINLPN